MGAFHGASLPSKARMRVQLASTHHHTLHLSKVAGQLHLPACFSACLVQFKPTSCKFALASPLLGDISCVFKMGQPVSFPRKPRLIPCFLIICRASTTLLQTGYYLAIDTLHRQRGLKERILTKLIVLISKAKQQLSSGLFYHLPPSLRRSPPLRESRGVALDRSQIRGLI